MHRQQLHDAEALVEEDRVEARDEVADRVEARDEVAQRALARDRRPAGRVERGGALGERGRALERAVRAELAGEGAVDRAPADRPGGGDLHEHVAALGPERAVRALGEEAGLRVERADVDEREADGEAAQTDGGLPRTPCVGGAGRFDLLHRDVVPVEREGRSVGVHRLDELAPLPLRAAEGGAQDGAAAGGGRALDAELEDDVVAAVAQERGGRSGGLDEVHGGGLLDESPSAGKGAGRRTNGGGAGGRRRRTGTGTGYSFSLKRRAKRAPPSFERWRPSSGLR